MLGTSAVVAATLLAIGTFARRRQRRRDARGNALLFAATGEAFARRHGRVTIEHLMLSLSFDDEIQTVLAARGTDIDALRFGVEEELGRIDVRDDVVRPKADARVVSVLRRARGAWSEVTVVGVLAAIESGPASRARRQPSGCSTTRRRRSNS